MKTYLQSFTMTLPFIGAFSIFSADAQAAISPPVLLSQFLKSDLKTSTLREMKVGVLRDQIQSDWDWKKLDLLVKLAPGASEVLVRQKTEGEFEVTTLADFPSP